MMQFSPLDMDMYLLNAMRGPLSSMQSLDVMWVSFYSIGAMLISVLILSATRKWIKNALLSFLIKFFAFFLFLIGSFLMVLVVFTWPS
ncbi:MAG TPA: DUF2768 domain-containing protein [Ureibacillus sp.]|nr:DUF2768 domain-containing protein [Ureibacillus sp.]